MGKHTPSDLLAAFAASKKYLLITSLLTNHAMNIEIGLVFNSMGAKGGLFLAGL